MKDRRLCNPSGFFSFIFVAALSCGSPPQSQLENTLVGGELASKDQFLSAIQIRHGSTLCSANFVSPRVLLTAAHCVLDDYGPVVAGSHISHQFYIHPQYGRSWWHHDFAVVVFDEDASQHYTPVAPSPPVPGSQVTILGYGLTDYGDDSAQGDKRFGFNTVDRVDGGRIVISGYDRLSDARLSGKVLNGNGDSGGPLLQGGAQVGLASSVSPRLHKTSFREGFFTNFAYEANLSFLRRLVDQFGLDIRFANQD